MNTIQINPLLLQVLATTKKAKDTDKKPLHHTAADPIRNEEDIKKAKEWFIKQPQRFKNSKLNLRNYLLFTIGINLGRRIGDTLGLRVGDFCHENRTIKQHLILREEKTGKVAKIYINEAVREALAMYIDKDTPLDDYLFKSRTKCSKNGYDERMSVRRANQIYNQMAKEIGLEGHISTHSTRKTAVYRMIKNGKNDIQTLINVQKFCNHSDFSTTLRYAGIQQEEIDESTKNISI